MPRRAVIGVCLLALTIFGAFVVVHHQRSMKAERARLAERARRTQEDFDRDFAKWHAENDFQQAAAPVMAVNAASRERGDVSIDDVKTLVTYMESPIWPLRQLAVSVGQKATSTASRQALLWPVIARLSDEVPDVRREAVYTLRVIGSTDSIRYLRPLLKDPDPRISKETAKTIEKLSKRKNAAV
jgi:HEAT repeat protein